ncbi:hypothetical protein HG535_0B03780 [Zygotorulaspora mrakii]|uniref:Major facilitator superfamily (MFS) profile domain-containing protein n=1 Tax=Zygotorulaspora mrakii TaxID=42260 RepID=A0A7H9AY41_ZYGMR|nr:uncharacterized protein HG535_0B03780 [Zygotorulaspora mrakii]QLG71338.1 hypothetical protein HG535_0B03780 [Zygotorulaspora mrakii]
MVHKTLTFKEQMNGFPWRQLLAVSIVRVSEPIAFTSLFPYVYFMVKDFHIAPDDAQVSKYSGYLSSSFALCQVLSAYYWGSFSERHGRKLALILGLMGSIVSLLILGFSRNFYQAMLARILMGLLNGNVGVIRTMIGEIATERRHQALAFSTMPLLFQLGSIIGLMIGGYLVFRPTGSSGDYIPKWVPHCLKAVVRSYPYALPNLVVTSFLFIGLVNAALFLEETHPVKKLRRDYGVELGDYIRTKIFGLKPILRPWQRHEDTDSVGTTAEVEPTAESMTTEPTETSQLLQDDNSSCDSIPSIPHTLTRRQSIALIRTYSSYEPTDLNKSERISADDGCSELSIWHHVFHTKVFYPISVNFIMSLHLTVYSEFLPVFLAYDLEKDPQNPHQLASKFPWKISGGISYLPQQTGTLLSTTGIFGVFVVIFIFPIVDRKFDCLKIFRSLVLLYPIIYVMVPYVIFLQQENIPKWWTSVYLYFITGTKTLCGALTFPQIMLLIHNSSPLSCRAVINGATISISAAARFIGPLIWGFLISWSEEKDVAWVSWWSLGLICMIALYQSYKIEPLNDYEDITVEREDQTSRQFSHKLRRSSLNSLANRR